MPDVSRAEGKRGTKEFISVAPPLYTGIPAWVRPLDSQMISRLHGRRDPFWLHAEGEMLLVRSRGRAVARLLVMHDRLPSNGFVEPVATFGLFEAPDDDSVAGALFHEAGEWARARGLREMVGPFFLSIHEETGLLVDGFDLPPRVMMPYGRDYYQALLQRMGFETIREFYSYEWDISGQAVPAPHPLGREVVIRGFDPRKQSEEVSRFLSVYNEAFSGNWGFVKMTVAEAESIVEDFLKYADLALPRLAEVRGEPAGIILTLPDFNQAVAMCGGKLWPLGFARLLRERRRIRNARVSTLAVLEAFRPMGIAHHLMHQTWTAARARGYKIAEFGYVDSRNRVMRRIIERIGARRVKTYRLYRKRL